MKALCVIFLLLILSIVVLSYKEKALKRQKRHHNEEEDDGDEIDLRRTKRNIYQALLKKKTIDKRSVNGAGIDIDEKSLIKNSNSSVRYRKEQVQDVNTRIEVIHEWRDAMLNRASPEYELLVGNIIDAIANEFIADKNFISAAVSKLTKTKSLRKIIADVTFRFYKSEDDPVSHIQGVIAKGWIAGQQVDPNYLQMLGVINGNHEKTQWLYPEEIELRVIPVTVAPPKSDSLNHTSNEKNKRKKPLSYKEIQISIKLKQRFQMFLDDINSPEHAELSGNLEQAILKIFDNDRLFIGSDILSFRESEEGRVIATIAIQFNSAEKYAIEKTQAMISSGDLAGMPVDEQFFIVNTIKEIGKTSTSTPQNTAPQHIPQMIPVKKLKTKPLQYKEVRVSYEDKNTEPYAYFSGLIEQAIDRGFSGDPNYIDATVVDFLESSDAKTISNIAVRFHLEKEDPEGTLKNLIQDGNLSGLPVDNNFFYVFTISTTRNGPSGQAEVVLIEPSPIMVSSPIDGNNQYVFDGQKQQAAYKPKLTNQEQEMKPSVIGMDNSTGPNLSEQPTQRPPITAAISTTFNPYLPNENIPSKQFTAPIYLDSSQGTINENPSTMNLYNYPYTLNSQQSWYPSNTNPLSQQPVPTYNPYLPTPTNVTSIKNIEQQLTYNSNLPESVKASLTNEAATNVNQTTNSTAATEEVLSQDIEGSMTLEQTWHPYLADKSSQVYKVLEQTVVTAIKNVYAEQNEEVVPEILGFSETDTPTNSITILNEKKVGVRFKVSFLQSHNASSKPLEDAVATKSVAGILIYQNSLVVAASSSHKSTNGLTSTTTQLTICQKQQKYAESSTDGPIGGFVPQCKEDGGYKSVQCHALTGFCWCVNEAGVRITGTEQRYKQPNCNQVKITGSIVFPDGSPEVYPAGSCFIVYVQEKTPCNGSFIDCQMPIISNRTYKELSTNTIEVNVRNLKLLTPYVVNAIFNVGWCSTGEEINKESVQDGDYITKTVQDFTAQEGQKSVQVDINLEPVKIENGITLSGKITLPKDSPHSLPPGSCLTLFIQELILCKPSSINCHIPLAANHTFRNIQIINNSIPYKFTTTTLKSGRYVLNAVVNMGWCRINSIKSSEQIRTGDYHTVELHDIIIESGIQYINKDIILEYLKPEETGIKLHGNIILPVKDKLTSIPEDSCLSIQTKLLRLCTGEKCPPVTPAFTEVIKDIEVNDNQIPYSVLLPELEPGIYVISAVLHVGSCPPNGQTMKNGDYFNDEMYDYTISSETTDVEKDVTVIKLNSDENDGVVVYGKVIVPETLQFLPGSCLSISSRKLITCRNNNCKIPPVASKTFENITNDNGVYYALTLPAATPGSYIISAVINLGWCKVEDRSEWIRPGDYYNDKIHDYEIKNGTKTVEKNITVQPFKHEHEKIGITVHGRVVLPLNSDENFPSNSCITIKAQEYKPCENIENCLYPLSSKQTYHNPQLENNIIPYALVLPNFAKGHYIISALLNVGWCKDDNNINSNNVNNNNNNIETNEWIHSGDYHNDEIHDFIIDENTENVEVDITVVKYVAAFTGLPQKLDGTEHIPSINILLITTPEPNKGAVWTSNSYGDSGSYMPTTKPTVREENTNLAIAQTAFSSGRGNTPTDLLGQTKPLNSEWKTTKPFIENTMTIAPILIANKQATRLPPSPEQTTNQAIPDWKTIKPVVFSAQTTDSSAENSLNTTPSTTKNLETEQFTVTTKVPSLPKLSETTTTLPFDSKNTQAPGYIQSSNSGTIAADASNVAVKANNQANDTPDEDIMKENAQSKAQMTDTELSKEIVTLPAGLPKSCREIRDAGISNQDGQYIIEARPGCHLSIICHGMDSTNPKEFLGGPSEDEWRYWHYAVLIKISENDKQNIPSGACLERTDAGRDLLKRVLIAGSQQENPINEWKINISSLFRSKRNIPAGASVITKAKKIYKGSNTRGQNAVLESEWGIL